MTMSEKFSFTGSSTKIVDTALGGARLRYSAAPPS
jgi:hypothetical protein